MGEVTTKIGSGKTPSGGKSAYVESGIPLIRSQINNDKVEFEDVVYIDESTDESMANSRVYTNDVLLNITGASIGRSAVYKGLEAANVNQHVCIIRLIEGYQSDFIQLNLSSDIGQKQIEASQAGGGREGLNFQEIGKMRFFFPLSAEQKCIGRYFNHLDNLITLHQRKYNINDKDEVSAWEQRKLGDISVSFEYGLNAASKAYDGENKYVRITDIDDDSHEFVTTDVTSPDIDLSEADNYKLSEGDILFARTGASVGKTYIYKASDGLVYYAGFLIRARIKEKYNAEFVFQNTLTEKYSKYIVVTSQRSGQPGVNAQEYAEYTIFLPCREEQDKIGEYLRSLDHLITLHQQKLETLQNIKKFMLEKMFI